MKKYLVLGTLLLSTSVFSDTPQFDDLSKSDVENIAREFSGNFAHTGVSAPETDGAWGIEVGAFGGRASSPELADTIDDSGGKGSDFENLYHAGAMARAHFPFDLFAELTALPEKEIADVTVKNSTFELGWNAGAFFGLPLDLAVGLNWAKSEISFTQEPTPSIPAESKISLESKTRILWVGVGKTFGFVSPYLKLGTVKSESDVDSSLTGVFEDASKRSQSVENSGGYFAAGANLQFFFFKLGAEISQVMKVKKATAKISFDF